jgi:hypothetical protein
MMSARSELHANLRIRESARLISVVRHRERRVLGGIKIDEAAQAIGMLGAEGVQDIAATRVPDESNPQTESVVRIRPNPALPIERTTRP